MKVKERLLFFLIALLLLLPQPSPAQTHFYEKKTIQVIVGSAPDRFVAATNALRDAFADGDDAGIARALADVAVSASDLADPFQMTTVDHDEVEMARARWSGSARSAPA